MPAGQNAPAAMPVVAPNCPPVPALSEPEMSKGEKFFNWGVYSGLNYWFNLASSTTFAHWLINLSGKDKLLQATGRIAKGLEASKIASLEKAHHYTKVGLETLALTAGGWVLIIPLKILEDHKRPAVHWLNKHVFHIDQTAPDGHELTPDEIYIEQEQPKQSWANVLKRRIIGTAAVVGSGWLIDHVAANKSKTVPHEYKLNPSDLHSKTVVYERQLGGKENVTQILVKGIKKGISYIPGTQKIIDNKTVWQIASLAALDTIFTKITAVIMHVTNGAKKVKMPKEIDPMQMAKKNAPPQSIISAATDTTMQWASADNIKPKEKLLSPAASFGDRVSAQRQDGAAAYASPVVGA